MPTTHTNRTMTIKHGILFFSTTLFLILTFLGAVTSQGSAGDDVKTQRIKFSHEFHVKEANIACTDCHANASKSVNASDNLLAKMESCKSCHEEQVKSNCTYCHTSADSTTYTASPNPVREFRFSHQQHVEDQKVDCESCHTVLDKAGAAIGELVPAMTICVTCHNDVKATGACEKCHTNLAALRPAEHNRSDFLHEHKQLARMGDAKCGTCHSQETCIDCHNGSELVKVDVPGRDLMSQHSPRLNAIDRGQGMVLTKVHDLNFRFTHGIAAKGKAMECQTCHSEEKFCSTCHAAGGNITQEAFKPASHSQAGFLPIMPHAVGSGGGEHARLARRDIESCAACHGSEGADPVCIRCHNDPDGIKGTDPRTHDPGFMSGNHGNWHDDPGATCYMCHTDSNARPGGVRGQKFCGYCHQHR
jgi:hypothetical protein